MTEMEVHNLIINKVEVRNSILDLLNINYINNKVEFIHEDQYPNGMYADFTIKDNKDVMAIMECKGSDIGVNDFVRGIGQILEYQHFMDNKLSVKGYSYNHLACAVYFLPSSVLRNKTFNIGLFKFPEKSKIIELNEYNNNVRTITEKELQELAHASNNNLVTISQYYIRDNRLFEIYICLKYCQYKKIRGAKKINRKDEEKKFLQQLGTPNNKNWRNAFISLSSLGLIDQNNLPTYTGSIYASLDYEQFCLEMYKSYIKEYIDLLMQILLEISTNSINVYFSATYGTISEKIYDKFNKKYVLYVTDSENRYLSSWLNIMRDDFACIDFASRSERRKVLYNITAYNENAILDMIKNNHYAHSFINRFNELL